MVGADKIMSIFNLYFKILTTKYYMINSTFNKTTAHNV